MLNVMAALAGLLGLFVLGGPGEVPGLRDIEQLCSPAELWYKIGSAPDHGAKALREANVVLKRFLSRPVEGQREALLAYLDKARLLLPGADPNVTHDYEWDYGKLDILSLAEGRGTAMYARVSLDFLKTAKPRPGLFLVSGAGPPDSGPNALRPAILSYLPHARDLVEQGRFDWRPEARD